MTRKPCVPGSCVHLGKISPAAAWLSALLLLTGGCFFPQKTPAEIAADEREKILAVDTIGAATDVGNVAPLQVQGVGLVTGLDKTGGGAPMGELRKMLEAELRKIPDVGNAKQLLDSHDTAMVIVTGYIPAGSRKGDPFDIQVTLPPGSGVKSLRGGYLQQCGLRVWDTRSHLNPNTTKPDAILQGHVVAKASGYLLVGLQSADNQTPNLVVGDIWDGAVSFIDRPFHFLLTDKRRFARVADAIAQRINVQYQDDTQKRLDTLRMKGLLVLNEITGEINAKFNQAVLSGRDTAKAVSGQMVVVNVPWEYRHNSQRYVMVARLIPLAEAQEKRQLYRQTLAVMLDDPACTIRAALRLEALGKESIPTLRTALDHKHPLVQFAAAEALAYLGDNAGVDKLAHFADTDYRLRAFCLTALASLDQTVARVKLAELLSCANSETRYGAFRALQLQYTASSEIHGEVMNNSFRLYRAAPQSPGLVHVSSNRRAEIVLFGNTPSLRPPFKIVAGGEFNVIASADDDRCTITRYELTQGHKHTEQSSLRVEDVLRTMADMAADYPVVVNLLRKIEDNQCLNCPICYDAIPQAMDIEQLAKSGLDVRAWGQVPSGDSGAVNTTRPGTAPLHYQQAVPGH
jgi:hypothetical protein